MCLLNHIQVGVKSNLWKVESSSHTHKLTCVKHSWSLRPAMRGLCTRS